MDKWAYIEDDQLQCVSGTCDYYVDFGDKMDEESIDMFVNHILAEHCDS